MTEEIQPVEPSGSRLHAILTKKHYVPKWIKRTFLYSVCTILGLLALAISALYLFAPQLSLLHMRQNSSLSLVPTPIADTSQTPPGIAFSAYGVSFNLPCTEILTAREQHPENIFHCKSGLWGIISNSNNQLNWRDLIVTGHDKYSVQVQKLLGPEPLRSNYALMKAAVYTNPNDVSFFVTRSHAQRIDSLCFLKSIYLMLAKEIYPVGNAEFNGFEFKMDDEIELELFDAQDHPIVLELRQGNSPAAQADANEIIQSLHKSDN